MDLSLRVAGVAKSYANPLFTGVNLSVQGPAKIALIGDNGSGKSTFLKMLGGKEDVTVGSVSWGSDTVVSYLEQELGKDLDSASGGEKKIIKLTQMFYSRDNVLLLDEPDNHLDLDNRLWFSQMVENFDGILIVISHDRAFLRNSVQKIWLLEEGAITEYPFGYDKFSQVYGDTMAAREHQWEVAERERKRLETMVKTFGQKAAANDAFAKMYHSMEKRYDRFVATMVTKPPQIKSVSFDTRTVKQPVKKTAIHLKNINKAYGENRILRDLSLHIFCGEKVAIVAPNGSGKSTLLNIISGRLAYDSG